MSGNPRIDLHYNGSKFAALGLSPAARREYAGTGVTVTAVLPSAVRTELSSGATPGKGMPTVDPEDVAHAVVDSVRRRPETVSVPGWLAPGWSAVQALVPRFIENTARRLVDDRRALTGIDQGGRRAYLDRIERHAREHTTAAPASKPSRKAGPR